MDLYVATASLTLISWAVFLNVLLNCLNVQPIFWCNFNKLLHSKSLNIFIQSFKFRREIAICLKSMDGTEFI